MTRLVLKAQSREAVGKGVARKLRAQGRIPAVIYGKGSEPQSLSLNVHDLEKSLHQAGGMNAIFDLSIDEGETYPVMVRDYQADIIRRHFLHVDLFKIDLSQKIKVEVPLELVGTSPGVKDGGILDHVLRSIEVFCLPTNIPEKIEVDISQLNIGDNVHVHDLKLPQGVELPSELDLTIASVVAPREMAAAVSAEEGGESSEETSES